jgi:hypothetical protein
MVLNGKSLSLPKLPDQADGPLLPSSTMKEMMNWIELFPDVVACLSALDEHLASFFNQYFGFKGLLS